MNKLRLLQNAELKASLLVQRALDKHTQSMTSPQMMMQQMMSQKMPMMEAQNGETSQQTNQIEQPISTPEGNTLPPNG